MFVCNVVRWQTQVGSGRYPIVCLLVLSTEVNCRPSPLLCFQKTFLTSCLKSNHAASQPSSAACRCYADVQQILWWWLIRELVERWRSCIVIWVSGSVVISLQQKVSRQHLWHRSRQCAINIKLQRPAVPIRVGDWTGKSYNHFAKEFRKRTRVAGCICSGHESRPELTKNTKGRSYGACSDSVADNHGTGCPWAYLKSKYYEKTPWTEGKKRELEMTAASIHHTMSVLLLWCTGQGALFVFVVIKRVARIHRNQSELSGPGASLVPSKPLFHPCSAKPRVGRTTRCLTAVCLLNIKFKSRVCVMSHRVTF